MVWIYDQMHKEPTNKQNEREAGVLSPDLKKEPVKTILTYKDKICQNKEL